MRLRVYLACLGIVIAAAACRGKATPHLATRDLPRVAANELLDDLGADPSDPGVEPGEPDGDEDLPPDLPGLPDAPLDLPPDVPPAPPALAAPASVDFGDVACGLTPNPGRATLRNDGGSPLEWSATIDHPEWFDLPGEASGTLAPGASFDLVVSARPVAQDAVPGQVLEGTLTVQSNDPARTVATIPVRAAPAGGSLVLTATGVDFGLVPVGTTAEVAISLKNAGNRPVTVKPATPGDGLFTVWWTGAPDPVEVAPGKPLPGLVARFLPTDATTSPTATLQFTVEGTLCGAVPGPLPLRGQGTLGILALTPAELDFGEVPCGTATRPQDVVMTNAGNGPIRFQATLQRGEASPYRILPPVGEIPAGGRVDLSVSPHPIPAVSAVTPDLYADTLVITTDIPGDEPHAIALHETAWGAILALTPAGLAFGEVPVGTQATRPVIVSNAGNASCPVTLTAAGPGFSALPKGSALVTAGGALDATVGFAPAAEGDAAGSLALGVLGGAPLCAPAPPEAPLFGTGTRD